MGTFGEVAALWTINVKRGARQSNGAQATRSSKFVKYLIVVGKGSERDRVAAMSRWGPGRPNREKDARLLIDDEKGD